MNSSSVDIKDYLESSASATGLVFNTDLFISREPEEPDAVVTIYDTTGEDAQANYVYKKPNIQVRIRSPRQDYITGYATAESIFDALHGLANITINSTRYIGIWAIGDINLIMWDENDRAILTVNFRIHRTTA